MSLASRIEKVDTFVVESAKFVVSTMLKWIVARNRVSIPELKQEPSVLVFTELDA